MCDGSTLDSGEQGWQHREMNCPKCKGRVLGPVPLEAGSANVSPVPQRCAECGGLWISRHAVPELSQSRIIDELEAGAVARADNDRRNGLCPEGHGILARARVSWDEPYFVERCSACDGIWLDAGEWTRLGSQHLLEHIDELWLPSWRRRLQSAGGEAQLKADLNAKLGPELFAKLEELGATLATHEHGDLGLAYLRQLLRRGRRGPTPA